MCNAVYFNTYKLKKNASESDFLGAVKTLFTEQIAKSKGYISSAILLDGETWADYSFWETMDDHNAFVLSSQEASGKGTNELAERFYSFCNFIGARSHRFSVMGSCSFDTKHLTTPNIISYHSYKLMKNTSVSDFLFAAEKVNTNFAKNQKGWLSSQMFNEGKVWADIAIFESNDDLERFAGLCSQNEYVKKCDVYMDCSNLRSHKFTVI